MLLSGAGDYNMYRQLQYTEEFGCRCSWRLLNETRSVNRRLIPPTPYPWGGGVPGSLKMFRLTSRKEVSCRIVANVFLWLGAGPWEHTLPSSHPSSSCSRHIIITTEMQISGGHVRSRDSDDPSTRQAKKLAQGLQGVSELNSFVCMFIVHFSINHYSFVLVILCTQKILTITIWN